MFLCADGQVGRGSSIKLTTNIVRFRVDDTSPSGKPNKILYSEQRIDTNFAMSKQS